LPASHEEERGVALSSSNRTDVVATSLPPPRASRSSSAAGRKRPLRKSAGSRMMPRYQCAPSSLAGTTSTSHGCGAPRKTSRAVRWSTPLLRPRWVICTARIVMALHVFLFLLVFFLLSLALLWRLCWLPLQPSHSRGRAMHSTAQRLLKPRTPVDCPACRLSCANSSGMGPAPAPVRPWREMKSSRGAPKRVNTEGFACSNQQCAYFGITDAQIHALVGDGRHGHAERIQTFRCQACRTTFSARRHTPLYRLKPPHTRSEWC
jgi:hypothetical protein